MLRALNPQIMKAEGAGNREKVLRLSLLASKFSFYLLAFFSIPFIFEMPYILKLWLKTVPDNTVIFCQLILVISLLASFSMGLMTALQSIGKIRYYQLVVGSLLILNLPISFALLKMGFPAYSVLICNICIEIISLFIRLLFAKYLASLSILVFLVK